MSSPKAGIVNGQFKKIDPIRARNVVCRVPLVKSNTLDAQLSEKAKVSILADD